MASIEELEATLQSHLDRTTLAVYADALQAAGDPRGELIALDLHIDAHGSSPELELRRAGQHHAWLGGASIAKRRWNLDAFRYGLLDEYATFFAERNTDYIDALYASVAAPYLRGVAISSANLLPRQLDLVVRRSPWLQRLRLDQFWSHQPSDAWLDAFEAATPNLTDLAISGRGNTVDGMVMFSIAHSRVERLTVARSPLFLSSCNLPQLAELTFDDAIWVEELVNKFPRLHVLDLTLGGTFKERFTFTRFPTQIDTFRVTGPRDVDERRVLLERVEQFPSVTFELVPFTGELVPFAAAVDVDHPRVRIWKRPPTRL